MEFAKKYDILIIHDNAYSDIIFDGAFGGSFLATPGAKDIGVEFFSLSKSFNVTGARLSFLVGRPDVIAALRKLRSQIDFGMFLPLQKAAIAALQGPLDSVKEQCQKYQERRDALCQGLRDIGWELPNGKGTMFVWAKIPGGRTDSMAFCMELMEKGRRHRDSGSKLWSPRRGLRTFRPGTSAGEDPGSSGSDPKKRIKLNN